MRIALSTLHRERRPAGPAALLDIARAFGVAELVLDAGLPDDLARAVATAARGRNLSIAALEHAGRARLCSSDKEERSVATHRAAQAIEQAGAAGAPICVVALGSTDPAWDEAQVARLYARAEWAPEDTGAPFCHARQARATQALDSVRFALERLVATAERHGVTLGLRPRERLPELPDVKETLALLRDFRGAPLGYWHDTAAVHREEALGLGSVAGWLEPLGASALGATVSDACGLLWPLCPGTGEVDFAPVAKLPLAALTIAPSPPQEVEEALALLRAL